VAAAYCGPAYHWVTAETIQIHGGLGFTSEHDAHLYYRRCRSSEQLFGSAGHHYDAVHRLNVPGSFVESMPNADALDRASVEYFEILPPGQGVPDNFR
jgi:hypothetical protein